MSIEIRPIREDEFEAWYHSAELMFGDAEVNEAHLEGDRTTLPLERTIGAFDGERVVGTASDYAFDMTVPGGATLPVAGVTAVSVTSTHRRRGLLRRMMERQLDDVVRRGDPIAILNASESSIYGRFGYGIAQLFQRYEIDTSKASFNRPVPERSMPMRLLSRDEARKDLPSIYEQCRRLRPGMLTQSDDWWAQVLGKEPSWKGGGKVFIVVADADEARGTGPGYGIYRVNGDGPAGDWTLDVVEVEAVDSIVEAQLFRYLLDVDLVGRLYIDNRPLDCPLRWWMLEPRQVHVVLVGDYLWVRLLDIERSLSARRYPVDDELVIVVDDPFRPETSGRYRVAGGPETASCERTHEPAHLAMDVAELGAMYLGQTRPSHLAAAGRVTELEPGALARADAFFGWPTAPWCVTKF